MMKSLLMLIFLLSTFGANATGSCYGDRSSNTFIGEDGFQYPKTSPYIASPAAQYEIGCYCPDCTVYPLYVFVQAYASSFLAIPGGVAPQYGVITIPKGHEYFAWKGSINGKAVTMPTSSTPTILATTDTHTEFLTIASQWSLSTDDPSYTVSGGIMQFFVCASQSFVQSQCQTIEQSTYPSGHAIANCEVDAGGSTSVDLGKILSSDFSSNGVPMTNFKKHVNIALTCSGVSSTSINANFYAEPDENSTSFAKSTISGVAVAILDDSGNTIDVNGGIISVPISSNKGTLGFDVAPVGTGGGTPVAGTFTSLVTVTLSIP